LLEEIRWKNGPECPHCGSVDHAYFLAARNSTRRTSTDKATYRRLWKCAECRKQFSVLVGTIFERSQVPLSKWLLALYMMSSNKNGVAAFELHRTLGVTNKTAWFMCHRIREAMKRGEVNLLEGVIEADETFIGGKEGNRHATQRAKGPKPKTAVLTLIETHTGEARSRVVPDVTGASLQKAMEGQVEASRSILHTDEATAYQAIGARFMAHGRVNHSQSEYVAGNVTTNHAEGFFSQLKRSIDGTHHHVSTTHLPRYLAEFDFRYSTRRLSDTQRMVRLVGQTGGRRLTYRPLASH